MGLELIHVGVHAVGRRRAHRATGEALRRLGGTGIENGMILEILRQLLALVEGSLELGVGDVAGHDDRAIEAHAGRDRILRQFGAHGVDTLVEVDDDALATLTRVAQLLGDELRGVLVHLLQPDTVGVDLGLDVAVGGAAHTHTDGAAGTVARQTDHADVVGQVLATKLGTETDFVGLLEELLLQVDVAEGAACLVARGGQVVIVLDAAELDGEKVLFGRRATDDEADVVGRAGCRAEALHLLHQERQERALVLDGGLGHGVEVGLVGGSAALGDHDEAILVALHGLDVNLCGEVAARVDLVVHV